MTIMDNHDNKRKQAILKLGYFSIANMRGIFQKCMRPEWIKARAIFPSFEEFEASFKLYRAEWRQAHKRAERDEKIKRIAQKRAWWDSLSDPEKEQVKARSREREARERAESFENRRMSRAILSLALGSDLGD